MDELANAPSNGAGDETVVADAVQTPEVANQVDEKPAVSAREAVERAFAKVNAQDKLSDPGEVKPETRKNAAGRDIGADGKFVAGEKPQAKAEQPASPAEVKPPVETKPAPSRFAKAAQDAWAQTPEAVRVEAERAINELTQGLEKYKGAAEAFEPVRKYHDMAQQSGTTLDKALDSYTNIENAWRANPAQGFMAVCQNMGHDPMQVLNYIAQQIQGGQVQAPKGDSPEVAALKQKLTQFEEKFGNLEQTLTQSQQQAQQREAERQITEFAKDHPYFEDLADSIANMLDTKFAKDLSDAYEKAVRLNPEVAAKIEADKAAKAAPQPDPAQTREKASKSITGTPSAGSNPGSRKPAGSAREALQSAFAQVGL